jgi:hypothetical protein
MKPWIAINCHACRKSARKGRKKKLFSFSHTEVYNDRLGMKSVRD